MKRLHKRAQVQKDKQAFALPTVIMMIVIVSVVAYAAILQANNTLSITYKQTYIAMARTASKSALDDAQEKFNNDLAYNGTIGEVTLYTTSTYRVTYSVTVISTSADGTYKQVRGNGYVYLPANSLTNRYASDFRTKEISTAAAPIPPAWTPPQSANLYLWYKFNNNMIDSVTTDPKYTYSSTGQFGYSTTILPYATSGNTHSLGAATIPVPNGPGWGGGWSTNARDRFGGTGTVCVWFKSADGDNDFGLATRGERLIRIRSDSDLSATDYITLNIYMRKATANTYNVAFDYDGSTASLQEYDSGVSPDTNWHNHCVTISAGTMRYYIDGVQRVTAALDATHNPFQNGFYITDYDGTGGNKFVVANGYFDDSMTWKVALSAAELLQIKNQN